MVSNVISGGVRDMMVAAANLEVSNSSTNAHGPLRTKERAMRTRAMADSMVQGSYSSNWIAVSRSGFGGDGTSEMLKRAHSRTCRNPTRRRTPLQRSRWFYVAPPRHVAQAGESGRTCWPVGKSRPQPKVQPRPGFARRSLIQKGRPMIRRSRAPVPPISAICDASGRKHLTLVRPVDMLPTRHLHWLD